jgi:hypothetical protein
MRTDGRPVAVVNFPEDQELAQAVGEWGIAPDLAQFEMELALGEPGRAPVAGD